jgi:hypothetical protein
MAELSARKIARECLGVTGSFSVNTHLYGYQYRQTDRSVFGALAAGDTLPGSGQARTRSLKRHLQTISGKATDLVIILVGHEDDFSGSVSRDEVTKIQYAIQIARDIYAQVDLGIRQINWQRIPVAQAGSFVDITDQNEAQSLTEDFSGPPGGIDVFTVQTIGNASGWSAVGGPCGKNPKSGMSGSVIRLNDSRRFTGVCIAHEVGHYLGLSHDGVITNVMGVDSNNDGIGELNNSSTDVTPAQGTTMKTHCSVFVKPGPYYGPNAVFAIGMELV